MSSKSPRQIKISSTSSVQAEYYVQNIVNHNTGKTSVVDVPKPKTWTKQATVLGNVRDPENYHTRTESEGEPAAVDSVAKEQELEQASKEYDTSQL